MYNETKRERVDSRFIQVAWAGVFLFLPAWSVAENPVASRAPLPNSTALGEEVADVALSDIRGKGSNGPRINFIEGSNLGVILWDEPGSDRNRNKGYAGAVSHGALQKNTMSFQHR